MTEDQFDDEPTSDSAVYYVERRRDEDDIYYCCFRTIAFELPESGRSHDAVDVVSVYDLWMRDRRGAGLTRILYEETAFSELDVFEETGYGV